MLFYPKLIRCIFIDSCFKLLIRLFHFFYILPLIIINKLLNLILVIISIFTEDIISFVKDKK